MKPRPSIHEVKLRARIIKILATILEDFVENRKRAKELAEYAFSYLDINDPYAIAYGLQEGKNVNWGQMLPPPSEVEEDERYEFEIYDELFVRFKPEFILRSEIVKWVAENGLIARYKVGDLLPYMGGFSQIVDVLDEFGEYVVIIDDEPRKIGFEIIERDLES